VPYDPNNVGNTMLTLWTDDEQTKTTFTGTLFISYFLTWQSQYHNFE